MNKSIVVLAFTMFLVACGSNPSGSGDKNTKQIVTADGKTITRKKVCTKVEQSTGSRQTRECRWVTTD